MSTSNLPIPDSAPNLGAANIPAHGNVLADGQGYVPDVALIERLANELFADVPGALSGATPPLGSAMPPRGNDLAIPLTGGDPLDLHLDTPRTHTPQLPVNHDWAPGADFAVAPNLDTSYPGEELLRALLQDNTKEHPKMTGAGFYFLDEAARFKQQPAQGHAPQVSSLSQANVGQIATSGHPAFDVLAVRRDFPILRELVNGRPLAWLDNAATTQKPQSVIDRLSYFYAHENSNIHRAAHELAARATDAYEGARDKVANFINASSSSEIIFVRGTTEAINLVAKSWGKKHIGEGDEILISHLEHHANIVPWQMLCAETGAVLRVAPVDEDGQVLLNEYERLLSARTKLVSFTQVSNALGTVTPAKQMIAMAHRYGAKVLLDGAQSVSHLRADVQYLDCDFFVFSGHKVFGPTGIGALYGKPEVLEDMPAWQGGGNMIEDVTFEKTRYHSAPNKFEAGTGNIADAVGLGTAIDYVQKIGIDNIARYEHELLAYAMKELGSIPGLRLIGTAPDKTSVLSFVLAGYQTTEVGEALNKEGIAVRTGHHCAQPILRRFGLEATVRPSLAFYNTHEEIDRLVGVVRQLARR
ncbi:family 2A encapsulin nanocompartment cargo protein cysteine desulfurase [Ferriphaselus sp. R-1]|uniref:family 2A encapsulin nanocompartment cargo protein cysteine desulfurase n=1 Tax=Ferriphaselus sp. R-1 TaxID=1485544 RepID=UPI000A612693|nr:family 2A encapsulin nanocompartment cargo protein cysteine desulfurase [Ferriphaselus sp. R-1]